MAQSIRIDTGEVRLLINDDENRVIIFNPNDISFLEAFFELLEDFEKKEKEFRNEERVLNANKNVDGHGLPKNIKGKIALTRKICRYMREKVDSVFGEGTSDTAFGKANTMDMFSQFFEGVTPFIKSARDDKTSKYLDSASQADMMS